VVRVEVFGRFQIRIGVVGQAVFGMHHRTTPYLLAS
jgi:hypothetical protein